MHCLRYLSSCTLIELRNKRFFPFTPHLCFFLLTHINWFISFHTPGFNIQSSFSFYTEPSQPIPPHLSLLEMMKQRVDPYVSLGAWKEEMNSYCWQWGNQRLTSWSLDGNISRAKGEGDKDIMCVLWLHAWTLLRWPYGLIRAFTVYKGGAW